MNIRLFLLRPLIKELRLIREELARQNDMREFELATTGLHFVKPRVAASDRPGEDPTVSYVDEQADYFRELQEELGRLPKPPPGED